MEKLYEHGYSCLFAQGPSAGTSLRPPFQYLPSFPRMAYSSAPKMDTSPKNRFPSGHSNLREKVISLKVICASTP
jgi:hypothetical protein